MNERIRKVITKSSQPCLLLELKYAKHLNFKIVLTELVPKDAHVKLRGSAFRRSPECA